MMDGLIQKTSPALEPRAEEGPHVLVVDDEPALCRALSRILRRDGYRVSIAENGVAAIEAIRRGSLDAVVSDLNMPELDGLALLRSVRETDLDLPVILITGDPSAETAIEAIHYGALGYLTKPVEGGKLCAEVGRAVKLHALARLRRRAQEESTRLAADRTGLDVCFDRALEALFMVFQPLVRWSSRELVGHEALVRSREPSLPHPGALLDAAERLERLPDLGRAVRRASVVPWDGAPPGALLFVNLHAHDLADADLYDPTSPLTSMANRVVLEVTERACLGEAGEVRALIARLRGMGFRVAVDDIGAGYAGLTSFATIEPDFLKLDMSIVRDVDRSPVKAKLIGSFVELCRDLGIGLVAEGVETEAERDTLVQLGCDLFQGYLFARPGPPFPEPAFGSHQG